MLNKLFVSLSVLFTISVLSTINCLPINNKLPSESTTAGGDIEKEELITTTFATNYNYDETRSDTFNQFNHLDKVVSVKVASDKNSLLSLPIPSFTKILSTFEVHQKFLLDFLNINATPLIDNIKEKDKYGNSGDIFYPVTRGLVDGIQTLSNVWSKAAEVPLELLKKLTRNTSEGLNQFGAQLVGLR